MTKLQAFFMGLWYIHGVAGNIINDSKKNTDAEELYSGWQAVGNDIRTALSQYGVQK